MAGRGESDGVTPFGTHAVRAGANIEAVRELMGHGDLETTAGYLHAVAADKVAAIEALDGQLAGNVDTSSSLTTEVA
jgi:hypothetical protein